MTFAEAAAELIEHQRPGWRNARHAAQWSSSLEQHAFPLIGHLPVAEIGLEHVLRVLRPIWVTRTETASRVRQRIKAVLSYARTSGYRPPGENPAVWRGNLATILPKPSKVRAPVHHAALPWQQMPELMARLSEVDSSAARALRFLVLTAARSGEVRLARWSEVDLTPPAVWTVPANRIKSGRSHRVPLVPEAIELLGEPGRPEDLLFEPLRRPGRPLHENAMATLLRRLGYGPDVTTVHGLRSSFRTWVGEATRHQREVAEAALAHRIGDAVERADSRGDQLQKRRRLMEHWTRFLLATPARVVQLDRRKVSRKAAKLIRSLC